MDLREAQKSHTRELLLKSAWDLYAAQGYITTTVGEIARTAGASRATFYLHFTAKWETAAELLSARLEPETLEFYRRLDKLGPLTREDLRHWLDDALNFYHRHRVDLAIWEQASAVEPELHKQAARVMEAIVDSMPGYLHRFGEKRADEARLRVSLLVTQLSDFAIAWTAGHWDFDRETLLDVLLDFWIAGMRVPVTAPR